MPRLAGISVSDACSPMQSPSCLRCGPSPAAAAPSPCPAATAGSTRTPCRSSPDGTWRTCLGRDAGWRRRSALTHAGGSSDSMRRDENMPFASSRSAAPAFCADGTVPNPFAVGSSGIRRWPHASSPPRRNAPGRPREPSPAWQAATETYPMFATPLHKSFAMGWQTWAMAAIEGTKLGHAFTRSVLETIFSGLCSNLSHCPSIWDTDPLSASNASFRCSSPTGC